MALAAVGGEDEEVFEVEAGAGTEGGVIVEEEGEAYGEAVGFGEEGFGVGPGAEEGFGEVGLGGYAGVGEVLVGGELLDEIEDDGEVGGGGGSDHVRSLVMTGGSWAGRGPSWRSK